MGRNRIYNGREKTKPFAGYRGPVVEYPLDHAAAASWAASVLPSPFFAALDLTAGAWSAPLPDDVPEDVANDFDHGVLPEPEVSDWRPFDADHFGPEMSDRIASSLGCAPTDLVVVPKFSLVLFAADWLLERLGGTTSALALIREMNGQPTEGLVAWTSAMGSFYPVSGAGLDADGLADLIDDASSSYGELVILTSSEAPDASAQVTLSDADLEALVGAARSVVLGAYDGEGYICWSRGTVAQRYRADGQEVD